MISVHIEQIEAYDDVNNEFLYLGPKEPMDVNLEHSLYSIAKWEEKYHKSYIDTKEKTIEETLDYMSMMVVGDKVEPEWFKTLSEKDILRLRDYMEDSHTATIISNNDKKQKRQNSHKFITAELIYYWMTALNIPFECQYWHLNRLMTLIEVCSIESDPDKNKKKKMTSADKAARRARMEAARAKYKH